jgi:hypothetical protein
MSTIVPTKPTFHVAATIAADQVDKVINHFPYAQVYRVSSSEDIDVNKEPYWSCDAYHIYKIADGGYLVLIVPFRDGMESC